MDRSKSSKNQTNVQRRSDDPVQREVPIEFIRPDDVSIDLINACVVQIGNFGEIIITVGQATVPILIAATEEERRREFSKIRSVKAKTVARLAFTPASLQFFLNTILAAIPKDSETILGGDTTNDDKTQDA
ncbi:MAG: hypothetical protein M3Y58_16905 [Chloroflexota bacterium]|nr:hypothetical protein [Chloroflexota bacterium]